MTTDEKRAVIERYLDAYNRFDVDRMMEAVHPAIVFRNVADGQVTATASGAREFRALADKAKQVFVSRKQTMTAFEASGNEAVIEVDYSAVLATDLPGGMKAGETLQLTGRSEFVFRSGTIYRLTDYS